MALSYAYACHRAELRASLRAHYGIDLRHPGMPTTDLAELTVCLPPGCALWIAVGGPMAWSTEQRALNAIEFRLRVLDWHHGQSKGAKPKPIPDPPYAHERVAKDASIQRKADAYLRRQARKG